MWVLDRPRLLKRVIEVGFKNFKEIKCNYEVTPKNLSLYIVVIRKDTWASEAGVSSTKDDNERRRKGSCAERIKGFRSHSVYCGPKRLQAVLNLLQNIIAEERMEVMKKQGAS